MLLEVKTRVVAWVRDGRLFVGGSPLGQCGRWGAAQHHDRVPYEGRPAWEKSQIQNSMVVSSECVSFLHHGQVGPWSVEDVLYWESPEKKQKWSQLSRSLTGPARALGLPLYWSSGSPHLLSCPWANCVTCDFHSFAI